MGRVESLACAAMAVGVPIGGLDSAGQSGEGVVVVKSRSKVGVFSEVGAGSNAPVLAPTGDGVGAVADYDPGRTAPMRKTTLARQLAAARGHLRPRVGGGGAAASS